MKCRSTLPAFALVLTILCGGIKANQEPQTQPILTQGSSNTWNLDWTGVMDRTYFIQWSLDLKTWHYFPVMEYGEGAKMFGYSASEDKFFVRLRFADIPTSDPELADFDGDGIGNMAELTLGTNPLDSDTDHDGVPDGVEVANETDPLSPADGDPLRAVDSSGIGQNDAVKLVNGTSPTLWDSDGDGYNDAMDDFPLDPTQHELAPGTPGDTTKPTLIMETPANAVIVSGP